MVELEFVEQGLLIDACLESHLDLRDLKGPRNPPYRSCIHAVVQCQSAIFLRLGARSLAEASSSEVS